MKKLLLLVVVVLAIGGYAHADKFIGGVDCTGADLDRECTRTAVCDQDPCLVLFVDSNNATCTPPDGDPEAGFTVTLTANADGADPSCSWLVHEGDQTDPDPLPVDIDSDDGLPVELLSFSVE